MLKTALESVKDKYDYILIDCAPSLGLLTLNALTAADSVLIPIQCEYFALDGLGKLLNTI
jgi:chromosome partitioning protein